MVYPREKSVRSNCEDDQEGDMTSKNLEPGINLGTERLSDAKNNATR